MIRDFIVTIDDSLHNAEQDIDELERKWGAEEVKHTCSTCKHYLPGEYDGSCGSYICKDYSDWQEKKRIANYVRGQAESEKEFLLSEEEIFNLLTALIDNMEDENE